MTFADPVAPCPSCLWCRGFVLSRSRRRGDTQTLFELLEMHADPDVTNGVNGPPLLSSLSSPFSGGWPVSVRTVVRSNATLVFLFFVLDAGGGRWTRPSPPPSRFLSCRSSSGPVAGFPPFTRALPPLPGVPRWGVGRRGHAAPLQGGHPVTSPVGAVGPRRFHFHHIISFLRCYWQRPFSPTDSCPRIKKINDNGNMHIEFLAFCKKSFAECFQILKIIGSLAVTCSPPPRHSTGATRPAHSSAPS